MGRLLDEVDRLKKRIERDQEWIDRFQGATAVEGLAAERARQENVRLKKAIEQTIEVLEQLDLTIVDEENLVQPLLGNLKALRDGGK